MPEGHTIRRLVVDQAPHLVGRQLAVSSPNRRFEAGAAGVDGRYLEAMDAWGKNLFYFFEGRGVLHVHLGMDGRFRHYQPPGRLPPAPRSAWLRFASPSLAVDLSSPKVCRLVDEVGQRRVVGRLGPDPLRADASPADAYDRVRSRRAPLGAALLDQSAVAGIGNVYRSEILFACGMHPETPAAAVTPEEWARVWAAAVSQLGAGVERRGDIVTVDRRDRQVRDGRRTYVYGQKQCARCGAPIRMWDLGGRVVYACETCQPRPAKPGEG